MHKIYFLFFLLLMGTTVFAQRKGTIHQRQIIIPPAQNKQAHSKAEAIFNESGLIPVKKGDSIFIQPDVIYPAKEHHILRGVIKTLGLGALAYQTNKTLHPFGGEGTVNQQQANQSIIPSLGIGFALSYPDFAGKPNKSNLYLRFLLYGKDSVPVAQKTVRLNKKTSIPIKGEVEKDGYIKVILTDNPKSKIISNDLVLNIQSVGQDENVSSINTSTSAVVKTISDTALSTSDTTVIKKLIPIRAFDEDDGEEGGGGGGGYGGGDPGDPTDPGDGGGGCDDPAPDPTTTTNTYQDGNELYSEVCTTTYPDCNGEGGGVTCETTDLGTLDCNGDLNGSAYYDDCGTCVGGNTYKPDCANDDCNLSVTLSSSSSIVKPGDYITLTATTQSSGSVTDIKYNFYGYMDGDPVLHAFDNTKEDNSYVYQVKVLGPLRCKVGVTYYCGGIDQSEILSDEVSVTSQFCESDFTSQFASQMQTAWNNTLTATASDNNAQTHEYRFFGQFNAGTPGFQTSTISENIGTCALDQSSETYVKPAHNINPALTTFLWTIGCFHTHPPLINCGSGYSRTPGPSSIDLGINGGIDGIIPRIVRDYTTAPVTSSTPLNAATTDYPYDVNCTNYTNQ